LGTKGFYAIFDVILKRNENVNENIPVQKGCRKRVVRIFLGFH